MSWTKEQLTKIKRNIHLAAVSLDDEHALETIELFPGWKIDADYSTNDRVQFDGTLYRCVQSHRSQQSWKPDQTPALWVVISLEEWPDWVQPTGAHDAYAKDAKVSHNEKHWISDIAANTYEPGVYGWTEQTAK